MENWKLKFKQALTQKLPGVQAHLQMAPYAARLEVPIPFNAHPAAVLVLLYENSDNLFFPLITRINNKTNDVHRGQISLPGGRKDIVDKSIQDTAIRECAEEIGIDPHEIEILGAMSSLYIPVSNHHVFPFVAWYPKIPDYKLQKEEVEALHEIPLHLISDSGIKSIKTIQTSQGLELRVPAMVWESLTIWGATGMILEELAEIYRRL
ncbi:MAG: CoA pyrophosphatase [Saprospiraceae bacterium]|nr:CoA pyrophosphatase [Saprospiraceae bacterium]